MKHLKSITLSNIRRFGADTKIELSRGATILLAPNGTGKTAIFEAIEFGLTGKISRLDDGLVPIIRDSESAAQVSLDFGDLQASARVDSIGDIERSGDLSALFPETKAEDIPFLLRLTHLLDQREGAWLVNAEPKIAGSQLERLPIGKDGNQVSSVLGGIRRALNDQLKTARASLQLFEAEFTEWKSLSLDRDVAAAQTQGALRSREHIAESLLDIARQTQSSDQLPAGLLVPPLGQDGLETAHEGLEKLVENKLELLREQITSLVEVDGLIGRFIDEQARIEQLSSELVTQRETLEQTKEKRAQALTSLDQIQQELVAAQNEREAIASQLNRHLKETLAKETVEQRQQVLKDADDTLTNAELEASTSRAVHEGNEQLSVQHNLIDGQRQTLRQFDADLLAAQELIERWEPMLQRLAEIAAAVSGGEAQAEELEEQLRVALLAKANADVEVEEAKSHHANITSAADSIRQAVASIATHLPSDRGDCPVCGEEHGAALLNERVAKALASIDPNVVEAERRLKKAADKLRERTESAAHAQAELKACRFGIDQLESQQAYLAADITELSSNVLLGGDTLPLARESVRRRAEANAAAKQQLDEKQSNLAAPVTPEVFEQARNAYNSAVRAVDAARDARAEASSRLAQATAALEAVTADDLPAKTLEELSVAQNLNASLLIELDPKVATQQSTSDRQQVELTAATNAVAALETQLSEAQARLATVRASWRQLSFAGDPSAEVASSQDAQLHSASTALTRHSEALQAVKIEISAWSRIEKARVAQGLLDRRRGEHSEDQYTAHLQQRVESERMAMQRFSQLHAAMESLNKFLSSEIENVQKHVQAVMPRWQALLKRIVRESRFTGTNLNFRTSHLKSQASVTVQLNGSSTPVTSIASEAQLTDLQLTFLLSMALEHQWSPWRGLLLDDPTQHHDLVHAAAVFDVLRDYIIDHDFQVVIATHDALQARYFMRKLQNDGIEARIWSLVPTPNGVTASETSWPGKTAVAVTE
ncbi:Chromosome partition protein Smc [Pseudomonas fluorescens]|nr:Chromosome partition protein Smc [Pseudomonas fluorescens]